MSYRKSRIRPGQLYVGERLSIVVLKEMHQKSHWIVAVSYQRIGRTEIETRSEFYLLNKVERAH